MYSGLSTLIRAIDLAVSSLGHTRALLDSYMKELLSYATEEERAEFLATTAEDIVIEDVPDFDRTGLKKLYHKMALALHPDRGGTEKEAKILTDVIKKYKQSDLAGLLSRARSLNIDLSMITNRDMPLLNYNLAKITKELKTLRESQVWKFGTKGQKEKETLARLYWDSRRR